jgi:hypothetical protein
MAAAAARATSPWANSRSDSRYLRIIATVIRRWDEYSGYRRKALKERQLVMHRTTGILVIKKRHILSACLSKVVGSS